MKRFTFLLVLFIVSFGYSQSVYKTPSGKKYHLVSCRMVENVSSKLLNKDDVNHYGLTACKICKPPAINSLSNSFSGTNKAQGTSETTRCLGRTKKGTRCKHMTRIANGYCYQHTKQNSSSSNSNNYMPSSSNTISLCGARTKSGGSCRRKVKGGGRCYQH